MALGDIKFLQFKSKEQMEKERVEYEDWAFPYGEKQKAALISRLKELKPKESDSILLISFLTCKELYGKVMKKTKTEGEADAETEKATIKTLIDEANKYKQLLRKNDLSMHIAMTIADAAVDENCEYPTADELRKHMQEIDELLVKKRR